MASRQGLRLGLSVACKGDRGHEFGGALQFGMEIAIFLDVMTYIAKLSDLTLYFKKRL